MFIGDFGVGDNLLMHPTMQRMHTAAKELLGIEGQSQLASAINETPQVVNNWESRGVSQRGAILSARLIGCSAEWLMTGNGPMTPNATSSSGLSPQAVEIAALFDLLPNDKVKRIIAFNGATQAILDVLQQH